MDNKKRKIIQKKGKHYSETERHSIIREMLKNKWTKQFAWELYTGEPEERGQLMRWMRKLGYVKEIRHRKFTFDKKWTYFVTNLFCIAGIVVFDFGCGLFCRQWQ